MIGRNEYKVSDSLNTNYYGYYYYYVVLYRFAHR
jgi:hypothetical protein